MDAKERVFCPHCHVLVALVGIAKRRCTNTWCGKGLDEPVEPPKPSVHNRVADLLRKHSANTTPLNRLPRWIM